VADRRGEAASVAEAQGFVDVDEAEAALLPADELARLLGQLAEHDRRVTEVAARLADPLLAEVDADDVTDLAPLAQARAAADEAAQEAQAGHARAEQRSTDAQTRSAAVGSAQAELAAVQARTAPVIRMADLVAASTGDNTKAMTLPTFVLLERFRDVVAAANQRLSVMSDGRYGLEPVVDKEGGKRSGLGLLVRDNHTEKARHPTTLSGGETFYCSLALALGLADVVTAEAGGIDLGTLFVDEGFGTLDPDTLDQVVTVLAGLRSGGRTVGIVSHVAELRDRISERVEVRRTPDGSSTLEVVA
jgi:exonuclease SbcC